MDQEHQQTYVHGSNQVRKLYGLRIWSPLKLYNYDRIDFKTIFDT